MPISALPDDVEALKRLVLVREADLADARARQSSSEALIAHLRLTIEKMRRDVYGQRSERGARLLDQMELEFEELEAAASEDELAAERAAAAADTTVRSFTRKRPSRKPLAEHLPRERIIVPGPTACTCCGSTRLAKLGEDVSETLEVVPRQWKVLQYVREKFTCRSCEGISQAPAPFRVLPRGFAGPSLLAMVLFEKYGQHQPLNRQAERYRREGVDLSLSTLADQVGGCAVLLRPLYDLIRAHVLAAPRVHADDTTVPVLAKGKTVTGRAWVYVRDERPFGGPDPPAAVFHYSRDRAGDHPERHLEGYCGIVQADAYAGFNRLYASDRRPEPLIEAACWAHARRKFFVLADVAAKARGKLPVIAPLAIEAVKAHRCDLCDRARDQWRPGCGASLCSPATDRASRRRPRGMDADRACEAVAACGGRQGDGLHAQALGRVRALPRRRPHLSVEQRRREGAAWHRAGPQGLALRRLRPRRRPCRTHVHPDPDSPAQRGRSAGLAQ